MNITEINDLIIRKNELEKQKPEQPKDPIQFGYKLFELIKDKIYYFEDWEYSLDDDLGYIEYELELMEKLSAIDLTVLLKIINHVVKMLNVKLEKVELINARFVRVSISQVGFLVRDDF